MVRSAVIEPRAYYDDGLIYQSLQISPSTLAKARKCGALRFTRKGQRTLYLGQWLLDWLNTDAGQTGEGDAA